MYEKASTINDQLLLFGSVSRHFHPKWLPWDLNPCPLGAGQGWSCSRTPTGRLWAVGLDSRTFLLGVKHPNEGRTRHDLSWPVPTANIHLCSVPRDIWGKVQILKLMWKRKCRVYASQRKICVYWLLCIDFVLIHAVPRIHFAFSVNTLLEPGHPGSLTK